MVGMTSLQVGDQAPAFQLPDGEGRTVTSGELLGQPLVLYFYPKDDSPGCTAQACAFRDAYQEFMDAGARVVGVSSDHGEAHRQFAEKHRLPFTLLSDARGELRRAFGVPSTLGLLPGRVTYVLDARGVVRHIFNSQLQTTRHVTEALKVVQKLVQDQAQHA